MTKAYQYDASSCLIGEIEALGLLPNNATYTKPPAIRQGKWPCWNGTDWQQVEDHRKRENMPDLIAQYGEGYPQNGTEYWLQNDTHDGPARIVQEVGPFPRGALRNRPSLSEEERQEQRLKTILSRLATIDAESIRPLRAIAHNEATQMDRDKLAMLEAEAQQLRTEASGIQKLKVGG